jgi:hypothetical protein
MPARFAFLRVPLFRLLAINLAAGIAAAALLAGGLLVLNPFGLRDLIFADRSPGPALGLLLFGFVVTFGSAAMGTAIMMVNKWQLRSVSPLPLRERSDRIARCDPGEGLGTIDERQFLIPTLSP